MVLALGHLGISVARQHRDTLSDVEQTTQNLVRVIEEQTRGGVNAVDVTLASLARAMQLLPGRQEPRNAEIRSLLRATLINLPFVRAVFVLDDQGNMIHDSDNLPGSFNLSDREYFRVHRDNPTGEMYIDPPIRSRLGVWFVATSRRIEKADGAFAGVVVAAIEPRYFEQFYESIKVGSTGVVALVRPDGTLIVRAPAVEQMRGKKITPIPLFVDLLPSSESGTYRTVSSVDGTERIYSYRKIKDRPLVVLVARGVSEALAGWRTGALAQGLATSIFILVIAWLGYLTLRELRRRDTLNLELHQAGRKLRDLIDGLGPNMFVGLLTPDGTLIEANAPALQAAGIQPQDVLGKPLEHTYWLAYSEPVQRQVRAAIDQAAAGTPCRFDLQIRVREEQLIWIDFSLQPLRDDGGRIVYLVPSGIDITERRRMQDALRLSEERYRKLAESSPDAILIHCEGRILFVNQAMVGLMRAPDAAALVGRSSTFMLQPQFVEPAQGRIAALYAGESQPLTEQIYVRLDGTPVHVEITAAPLTLDNHPAAHVTVRDVTERHLAEALSRESAIRLQLAARAGKVGLWDWELGTDKVYFSPEWKAQLGYEDHEIENNFAEWQTRVHPEDLERTLTLIRAFIDKFWPDYQVEFRLRHKDGSYRWIFSQGALTSGADGRPARMLGSHIDITERKRAQSFLEGQRQVLERVAKGAPLAETLEALTRLVEAQYPEMLASILLLDSDERTLRHGAAPSLPRAFVLAIDGESIGERAGSCGTAAFRREAVIVEDIDTDPLWQDYRGLAQAHGLRACWSTPVYDAKLQLMGTFALYFRSPGKPTAEHLELVQTATSIAGIAIGREREEQALRHANQRLNALSQQLLAVQEKERAEIARELHDELGQSLTALKLNAVALGRRLKGPAADKMDQCVAIVDQALAQTRGLALDLRPPQLDQLGLASALSDYLDRIAAGAGLKARFIAGTGQAETDKPLAIAVFRVAQEALTNVVRHAKAKQVVIELRTQGDELLLAVADDGSGYDHAEARARAIKGHSMGILGIEERVALAGGRLRVITRPGQGTRVQAEFPIRHRKDPP